MGSVARKKDAAIEVEDDGPVLRPDLSDLFAYREAAPKPPPDERDREVAELFAGHDTSSSGLIDMRSLATAYLTERRTESDASGAAELPHPAPSHSSGDSEVGFEGAQITSFEKAPERRPVRRSVRYGVVAGVGLLTVAATALATTLVVRSSGSERAAEPTTAPQGAAAPPAGESSRPAPASPEPAPALAAGAEDEPKEKAVVEFEPDPLEPVEDAPRGERAPRAASEGAGDEEEGDVVFPASAASEISSRESSAPETPPEPAAKPETKSEPAPAPKAEADASEGEEYDDVDCLLNPNEPRCQSEETAEAEAVEEDLPERLERSDIEAGLRPIRGRLTTCADRHGVEGVVKLIVQVSGAGQVTSARTSTGGAEFKQCVGSLLRKTSFARTESGHTFRYPLILR